MSVRLNKIARDLNVGIITAVEFLQKKGFTVEANPNTKITDEQYDLLLKEFSTDKDIKQRSDKFIRDRHTKDRNKTSVAIEGYENPKEEEDKKFISAKDSIENFIPKFKPVGKIELDKLNGKIHSVAPQAEPSQTEEAPKTEEAMLETKPEPTTETLAEIKPETHKDSESQANAGEASQSVVKEPEITEEPVVAGKEPEPEAGTTTPSVESVADTTEEKETRNLDNNPEGKEETEEIFRIRPTEPSTKLNVIGQIDLNILNQSTRPKKKSKEERKRERDEKEKARQDQRKQIKDAIIKEIRHDDGRPNSPSFNNDSPKKKRQRIVKERVDINDAQNFQHRDNDKSDRQQQNNNQQNFGGQQGQNKKNKDRDRNRNKQQAFIAKQDVSEEDVAKQVKETLARLTSKSKSKGAKYRKEKREMASNRMHELESQELAESRILKLTEFVTANELATMMDVSVTQVISTCMSVGIMVSINQRLDAETINLVADEFGFKTEYVSAQVAQTIVEEADAEEDLEPRAPIVTVMGHVDHGKTSLLDYIRKSNVIAGEAGGITQHIGAYHVTLEDGRKITFLDTPGHEAFTAMRARGAKVTDVVVIIVAADDDVMPQTKEAISHATAAGVPIVFAINKVDKPTANPDKIKEQLAAMNFLVEDWGGKYQSQDISAKKGTGVNELMEKVLLEAEMLDLKANPNRKATGSIIESSLDKGRGYVATVLVSNGTLKKGDIVLAGTCFGRVKAMFNERNQQLKEAGPSEPALILGLNGAPAAGDTFHVFDTEQEAREVANKREQLQREQGLRTAKILTLDEIGRRLALGDFHELNLIVKGDVDGSVEALSDSLIKLSTEQIQVNVIHKAVGQISESDVSLAAASDAIIIGFQVRPSGPASRLAEQEKVDIRKYSVIYDAIEEVKSAMEGMLAPTLKEQVTATIEVREVFHISKVGQVAGAMVKTGKVKRTDKARLIRDGIVVFTGSINALKRFKDDVKEVATNFECGISLTNCNDIKVGDIIESYEEIEVKKTL
ncbi:MAG: translation initiation factor IF-2 [Bacteroidales bacterium]|nr:translation initiation factor IF-2 [Bacteroidales bacterium]